MLQEISRVQPNVIINCAAFTDVDGCETEIELANRVFTPGEAEVLRARRILEALDAAAGEPVTLFRSHRDPDADIDAVVADRPVWLRRVDGHAGWANSKALEIAGITADTPDPVGGKIIREPGPMNAGTTIIAFVEDPDGYKIEFIER